MALLSKVLLLGLVLAVNVWLAVPLYRTERWVLLGLVVVTTIVIFFVYLQPRAIPPKYLLPGTIFLILFQVFPVIYTISTAFTNFGDGHRGTKEQAIVSIEGASVERVEGSVDYVLTLAARGDPLTGELAFLLVNPTTGEAFFGTPEGLEPFADAAVSTSGKITDAPAGYELLTAAQAGQRSEDIAAFTVPTESGAIKAQGLSRAFEGRPVNNYEESCDCVTNADTGEVWTADNEAGLFANDQGQRLPQGWKVNVGLDNFTRIFTDSRVTGPFFGILVWNFAFAIIVVGTTFVIGLAVAMALNSERVRGLRFYRVIIVLPYAMPAFAMMLVWRDMFNQDFGLINNVTGLDVNWYGNPWTARFVVVLIQFWLGYPYMFLVTTGALQSIPTDLTEAAGVDGAKPFYAFRTVTFPLLLIAVAPLLISSFAFNFNNYNAIAFTTEGGPFPPDSPQAGQTDLLISYTYRLAFGAGGAQYGFAAAVSIIIFVIVAGISIISFRRTAVLEEIN
jgi:arabinogalactan oligomer/maltooligosaccharide transport system permease protein